MESKEVPVTPFLDTLKREGGVFTNIFPQHTYGGGTSDSDFSVLTSFKPRRNMPSLYAKGIENLISLPKALMSLGYESVAYHANSGGFYGRSYGYSKLGIEDFVSRRFLPKPKDDVIALPDGELFDFVIKDIKKRKSPLFAFIVTLSSHGPYDTQELIPLSFRTPRESNNDIELHNYIDAIRYVDLSLEKFVKDIDEEFENWLIFIYGDHPPVLKSLGLKGNEKIPLFILSSRGAVLQANNKKGSQYDFPTTVLSELGISPPPTWIGIDLLERN